jgi:hypothetical protein
MSATPDQLPNDIEEMKRLFLAQSANLEKLTADLAVASAELAAAKAGLMIYALEIEKLKFQQLIGAHRARDRAARVEARRARSRQSPGRSQGRGTSLTDRARYARNKSAGARKKQEAAPQVPGASAAHSGRSPIPTRMPHAGL